MKSRSITEVKQRPKRDAGHPSRLRDYYVEPVLKLKRKVLPHTNPLVTCTTGIDTQFHVKRNLLTWMINSGVTRRGGKLKYAKKNCVLDGVITSEGVVCSCCRVTMSLSSFTSHAEGEFGAINYVYVDAGRSFIEHLLISWRIEATKVNHFNYIDCTGDNFGHDTCDICACPGDLICCDGCPSMFHISCLQLQRLPSSGQRHCLYCSCKFCGTVTQQIFSCSLCDEKFHKPCRRLNAANLDSGDLSFCGKTCHKMYERLQPLFGVKKELGDGFFLTLLRHFNLRRDSNMNPKNIECNSKLAVAYSVMEECFDPVVDHRSGVDIIRNVVYNCRSNYKRLNHGSFFTAILEKDDEVISVASIRIHGNKLAEMPYFGTRKIYRRQGMCRRLIHSIESILYTIGVHELIIRVIPSLLDTMTKVNGFKPLEESTRQRMKSMSTVVLPGTYMLQKPLRK